MRYNLYNSPYAIVINAIPVLVKAFHFETVPNCIFDIYLETLRQIPLNVIYCSNYQCLYSLYLESHTCKS